MTDAEGTVLAEDPAAAAHVVDDDPAVRDALQWLLKSRGVPARLWSSGEAFLEAFSDALRGCVVLDVRMTGMSGVEVHEQLLARGCGLPILFLTGHGEVGMAVAALKRGAFDFVEKPFDGNALVDRIVEAMQLDASLRQAREEERRATLEWSEVEARLDSLTPREREVMERILTGDYNKMIADALGIAVRTVEVHRARVFEKMRVRSAVELAGLLARLRPAAPKG